MNQMSSQTYKVIEYSDITVYESLGMVSVEQRLLRPYCSIKIVKEWLEECTDGHFNFKILQRNPSLPYLLFRFNANNVTLTSNWPDVLGFLRTLKTKFHPDGWYLDYFLAFIQRRVKKWITLRRARRLRFQLAVSDPRSKLFVFLQDNRDLLQLIEHFYWLTLLKKNKLLESKASLRTS